MTNADKIRAMTDEELTEWLCSSGCCDCPHLHSGKCEGDGNAWLDWLKQEVPDNG